MVWKRNLVVLGAGQLLVVAAMGIVIPLVPFFLRELGMTDRAALERWSGLVFSGPFLLAATMSPVWGYLGDRFGHKKMVIRAVAGLAAVNFLLVFVQTPAQFLLLRFLQGAVTGFVPASLAITSASTPRDRLPEAMGKLMATASAGRLLGPALGGLLAGLLAFRMLFLLVGVIITTALIFVVLFLEEPPTGAERGSASLTANLHQAVAEPTLRLALPGMLVSTMGITMTMPIFPLYVEDRWGSGLDPMVLSGIGFATVAGFTLLTSTFLGRIAGRLGLKMVLVIALTMAGFILALHPLVRDAWIMLFLRALLGVAAAGIAPVLHAMISRAAPEGMRGGITGLANSAMILGFFAGPVGGGLVANQVGVDGVFRVAATLAVACGVIAAIVARRTGRAREIPPLPGETPR